MIRLDRRSLRWGAIAASLMLAFYSSVIVVASGANHLSRQLSTDWYFVVPIVVGFGAQVAMASELHRRRHLETTEAAAATAGTGASTVGMLACCAHHLTEVAAFAGATGALGFLATYRIPFMLAGIAMNSVGLSVAARRLVSVERHGEAACAAV